MFLWCGHPWRHDAAFDHLQNLVAMFENILVIQQREWGWFAGAMTFGTVLENNRGDIPAEKKFVPFGD
jgi:hypothetical protein